jgi:hypothetical protein
MLYFYNGSHAMFKNRLREDDTICFLKKTAVGPNKRRQSDRRSKVEVMGKIGG